MKNFIRISMAATPAIIFGAAILTGGCSKKIPAAPAAAPVLVAQVMTTNVPVEIQPASVGHVLPIASVTIRAQIGGILQKIYFKEGAEVKSNALLFTIDPRPTQAALEQTRANLERDSGQLGYAKANYARDQKLFAQKIVSQDQIDTDRSSLDASVGTVAADQAAITNAELNLEFTQIRAPFDGVTGSLPFQEGNVVKATDDTLLTINQIHPIYVEFAVPERYLPVIKSQMRGQPLKVRASFENISGPPPQGELTFVENTVDPTTGTIDLKATFSNTDSALWPGQFVTVELTLSELTNALVVPSQAVQTGQSGSFVYVVKADQTVEQRAVTTGVAFGGKMVIAKGLQSGETVVTDGQLRLAPGVKVNAKKAEAASATNSTAM